VAGTVRTSILAASREADFQPVTLASREALGLSGDDFRSRLLNSISALLYLNVFPMRFKKFRFCKRSFAFTFKTIEKLPKKQLILYLILYFCKEKILRKSEIRKLLLVLSPLKELSREKYDESNAVTIVL
jgi:hypothetical protein